VCRLPRPDGPPDLPGGLTFDMSGPQRRDDVVGELDGGVRHQFADSALGRP
jgi:hypothetical protein